MTYGGAGNIDINVASNFVLSSSPTINNGGTGDYNLTFDGASQLYTGTTNFTEFDFIVNSNSILEIGVTSFISTTGDLLLNNLGEIHLASTAANGAIQSGTTAGNIRVSGTRTYTSGSTIVYNGSSAQFIGSGHPSTSGVNTEINNSNGVTLASNVTIGGELALTSGNLTIGSRTLTIQGAHSGGGSLSVNSTSTLIFSGSGAIGTIPFVSATPTLGTLTIDRSGEVAVFEDNVTIGTALNLTQGNIDIRDRTLNLTGTLSGTGNLLSNSASTINITGTGAVGSLQFNPSFNTIGNISYNRPSGTLTLNGTLNVTQSLVLTNGTLTNNANLFMGNDATLTKNSNATFSGDSPETTGGALYNVIYTNAGQTTGSEIPDALTTDALGDITINTSGSLVLDQNLQVNGNVTLNGGSLSIGANSITVLGNWVRNGGSLATYTGQVIFNGTSLINGSSTATFVNVQVPSGATLTLPSGNVNINGNLQIDPAAIFSANGGTVTLGTTANQNIAAGGATFNNIAVTKASGTVTIASALNLAGRLSFDGASAATIASGGNLTIRSTSDAASGNGSIGVVPSGANITGNVIVQRFLSGEGRIYRYISSPVSGANFEQWRDDFPITGTFSDPSTGAGIVSSSPSLYRYNESTAGLADDGYEAHPASGTLASSIIEVGRGYAAFIREGSASTLIDVTGPVNLANSSNINLNVTFNDSGNGAANEGWNLVGNPFPASIDWDNILGGGAGAFTNIDNGIHIRDNGSGGVYRTYDGSVGDLTGGVIATGQAFWVRANANSPSLTLNESAKSTTTGAFYRQAKPDLEIVQIALTDGIITDNAYVSFKDGFTSGYDLGDTPNLDNVEFDITTYGNDENDLAINYVPYGCATQVPINVSDVETGSYTLLFSQLESLTSISVLTLKDNYTDVIIDLSSTQSYEFSVDESVPESFGKGRFILEFGSDLIQSNLLIESDNNLCDNESASVVIKSSQLGVNYTAIINGQPSNYEFLGDGNDIQIEIAEMDINSGLNEIYFIGSLEGCEQTNVGDVLQINKTSINTNLIIDSKASICQGENGIVTLNDSENDVTYQLVLNNSVYGDSQLGNGSDITFEVLSSDLISTNDIKINASLNNCTSQLSESLTIDLIELNTDLAFNADDVCKDDNAIILIETPQSGVEYQIILNEIEYGDAKVATEESLTFELQSSDLIEENLIKIESRFNGCTVILDQTEFINKVLINPIITREENVLISNYDIGNTWYLNGEILLGANGSTLEIEQSGFYELQVDFTNCSERVGENYVVEEVTSISENTNNNLRIYPNPASNRLFIESMSHEINKIEIIDAKGKVVYQDNPYQSTFVIYIDNFVNGIYMIRLQFDNKLSIHRLIKQ
ncbi:MAG: T9SS type A sorting domain-containing protein [Fulvivirga sp.]